MFAFTPVSTISQSSFTPQTTASTTTTYTPRFSYDSRARSSSPAAQLSKLANDTRERRKFQFLDRIKSRRVEGQDERIGDQLLRMDYVKERRIWEEEMRRRATEESELEVGLDTEMESLSLSLVRFEEDEAAQVESPTEEKEIEELVSYLQTEKDDDWIGDDVDDEALIEILRQGNDPMDVS
jgi:hypothetical protein